MSPRTPDDIRHGMTALLCFYCARVLLAQAIPTDGRVYVCARCRRRYQLRRP